MHERIKQLVDQAHEFAYVNATHNPDYQNAFEEKFAELIIKKCLHLCKTIEHYDGDSNPETNGHIRAGAAFCRADIKEHFGVEE